ncbi:MAG: adenylate cyclase [Epsilonproteobacteria bacterium (ex Lamellibrachia satsuma)]|nr:MAG: adenylate cyclase [Epsilonproteobacteria bacterium (ex Lamellibrachia satsuma)]
MAKEIERKFLVDIFKLPTLPKGKVIKQGYIPTAGTATVRARISDDQAFLTLKGKATGLTRSEFEYPVPLEDAQNILNELCSHPFIEKTRYLIPYGDHIWELDIFEGENEGLIVAEIELENEDEIFEKPAWVTQEVSDDTRYRNSNLITHPFKKWDQ